MLAEYTGPSFAFTSFVPDLIRILDAAGHRLSLYRACGSMDFAAINALENANWRL